MVYLSISKLVGTIFGFYIQMFEFIDKLCRLNIYIKHNHQHCFSCFVYIFSMINYNQTFSFQQCFCSYMDFGKCASQSRSNREMIVFRRKHFQTTLRLLGSMSLRLVFQNRFYATLNLLDSVSLRLVFLVQCPEQLGFLLEPKSMILKALLSFDKKKSFIV